MEEELKTKIAELCSKKMSVEILPAQTRLTTFLLVIKDNVSEKSADDWFFARVSEQYQKLNRLLEQRHKRREYRLFFYNKTNQFVFYTPLDTVFNAKPDLEINWYGNEEETYGVADKANIEEIISFLTTECKRI